MKECKYVILTRIATKFECDVFLDPLPENFVPIHVSKTFSDSDIPYDVVIMGNRTILTRYPDLIPSNLIKKLPIHEEMQYLNLIRSIISTGAEKTDRTGTGTISHFGSTLRFDLS